MDLVLLLGLLHGLALLAWAGMAMWLGRVLLAGRRDPAARRAVRNAALIERRGLRATLLVALLSGVALAWVLGTLDHAWAFLTALLVVVALGLGPAALQPACARALRGGAALTDRRRALRLVALSLGLQGPALMLLVVQPGWGGMAILAGLLACLALAGGLMSSLGGDGTVRAI